jgi:hypothetical protein
MTHPWFFATNALTLSDPDYINMTLAMLASQRINAPTLVPHMIYDGPEDDFCDTVKQAGVHVIHNEFSMLDEIKKKHPRWSEPIFQRIARGAYLRMDIPTIAETLNFSTEEVLYTDIDVLFLKQPEPRGLTFAPFAVGPEFDPNDYITMNTGVMYINIPNMAETRPALMEYVKNHHIGSTSFDQDSLRRFYAGQWGHLPIGYNWKPYWGVNTDATIVHFHGPKPSMRDTDYAELHIAQMKVGGYDYYCGVFDTYLGMFK